MKNRTQLMWVAVIACCFATLVTTNAQSLSSKIDKILTEQFKENESGVSALVAKNGKVLYRKAFGMANLELEVPMRSENVFQIGSITKQFTAVGILMLLEEGKLSLEDDITKFIPDYPTKGKKITVHHLLTHTSGIKSYTGMPSFGTVMTKDESPLKFIDFFKNEPLDFEPGSTYKYNNSGYFLLGYIIEKASGMTYPKFLEKRIFSKLDMQSSYFGSHTKFIKNRASGYQKQARYSNAQYISLALPYAAGSIMSSVDDMLKWQQAINANVLVSRKTIDKAFTNYSVNNGDKINYGYGWSLNEINGVPTIEHGGAIPGYLSMGIHVPSEDIYVILFSNCGCKSPTSLAIEIAALAMGKPAFSIDKKVKLTKQQLNAWVGAYQFENDAVRFITIKDGQLYSQREGSSQKFKIHPVSESTFAFEDGFIKYDFSKEKGKKVAVFKNRINKSKGVEVVKKAPKEKKVLQVAAATLSTYEGEYQLQQNFTITIESKGNQLFAQATGQPQFEIFAESKTRFFFKVVKASIEFHTNKENKVTSLTLHQAGRAMNAPKQ